MTDVTQPITAEDFLVTDEENTAPIDNTEPPEGVELLPEEDSAEDARSAEEKLIDELAASGEDGEEDAEEDPDQAEDIPPPPDAWAKDADAWKDLTPAAREVVARREKEVTTGFREMGRKVAETKAQYEREAITAVAQHADNFARQLQGFAERYVPQPPNPELLYTGNADDVIIYQRQDAAHRAALSQQNDLQQRIAQSQQQAEQARNSLTASDMEAEREKLRETLPEFFDPDKGPDLQRSLELTGQELGYSAELMAQAGATDMLALKTAAGWREDAMKYRKIVAKRMETVRGAKKLPTMTRPGGNRGAVPQASAEQRTKALQSYRETGSAESAASLLLVRTR